MKGASRNILLRLVGPQRTTCKPDIERMAFGQPSLIQVRRRHWRQRRLEDSSNFGLGFALQELLLVRTQVVQHAAANVAALVDGILEACEALVVLGSPVLVVVVQGWQQGLADVAQHLESRIMRFP